jgi:hypothetical protein
VTLGKLFVYPAATNPKTQLDLAIRVLRVADFNLIYY